MIDETWLRDLQFDGPEGTRITGLLGLGSESVVFSALGPDGSEVALKVYRHHLGFHIRELPLFLTAKPSYDFDRLNQKLLRLLGNPLLDSMTQEYDRLYSSLISILKKFGVSGLIWSVMTPESTETLPFILHTPGMRRRLQDWASLPEEVQDAKEMILEVNGPSFPITVLRVELIHWAKETLQSIDDLWQVNPDLRPDKLPDNPLYVWGAAVMDGFFTEEELPRAANFLQKQFGPLPHHPQAATFIAQADALAHLLAQFLKESQVARFVKFCALAGFLFQVIDRNGNTVADGFQQ
jgi:hypothetical protein